MAEEKIVSHQTSEQKASSNASEDVPLDSSTVINASGHVQEVERNFSLLSLASVGIVTGSEWPALGGSILVAIYNGGSPGVIWEL